MNLDICADKYGICTILWAERACVGQKNYDQFENESCILVRSCVYYLLRSRA